MRRLIRIVFVIGLLSSRLFWPAVTEGVTLAGQAVRPGGTLDFRFPVDKYFQDYAAQGGNPRPTTGRALLIFPQNFDSARSWPILIVTSTSDAHRTSPMDAPFYQRAATAEGWIVLATDATIPPRIDSPVWRLAILAAGLQTIHKEWPQSAKWPVAFAGFSGGAKCSGDLGAMLAKSGTVKVCGFFLAGINDDRLSEAYQTYQPPANLLNVPIWLSGGTSDQIASPAKEENVRFSLQRTGFKRVRLEPFNGRHEVNPTDVQRALRWFREVGKF